MRSALHPVHMESPAVVGGDHSLRGVDTGEGATSPVSSDSDSHKSLCVVGGEVSVGAVIDGSHDKMRGAV